MLCCKVCRFVVNVRNTHSGLYTKYIVILAFVYLYIYIYMVMCTYIYTSGLPCVHTDTRDALEIHSRKTFYLLTLCKEIFLKEIIVCIKKSPPSCVHSFPWSSPSWLRSCRLGRVWARRIRTEHLRVRPRDASCNSYKNKPKIA